MRNRRVERFIKILRQRMPELKERYNVTSLGLFGSYVRNQQTPRCDLDILVEFAEAPHIFISSDSWTWRSIWQNFLVSGWSWSAGKHSGAI